MIELFGWSQHFALGYSKHPPLAAWLVRLWFGVFPVAEWSYYLLAMLMPVTALWIIWRMSADYLDDDKRVFGLAMLTLVPFFNFWALRFNMNTVLLPLWAAATLFFLRSYRTRNSGLAALAGLAAGACLLAKYWSLVLIAAFAIGALVDPRRAAYFRSPAPWISAAVALAVVAPHLVWLVQHDFTPLRYAVAARAHAEFSEAVSSAVRYVAGFAGYALIPLFIMVLLRPGLAAVADIVWPRERERRLAAAVFWPLLLLPPLAALGGTQIGTLWSMSAYTLLPALLLSPPAVTLVPVDMRRILIAVTVLPLLALLVAPRVAVLESDGDDQPVRTQAPALADRIEHMWRAQTSQPLRFVGADTGLSRGISFYAADHPYPLPELPQPDALALARAGAAYVCFADKAWCFPRMQGRVTKVTISAGSPPVTRDYDYVVSIVPPAR